MKNLGKYLAFKFIRGELVPVERPAIPNPEDLLGIDRQKETVMRNTLQFVRGFPANDVLLWGARGTGKSSLVRSLLKPFGGEGLKLIQIYKWDIPLLSEVYSAVREAPYRFILFFDDLSFEPSEEAFKLLKSLLDGDVEERPENLLVYVTSNRRNLMEDKDEELSRDSLQERLSLVDRFGVKVGFFSFDRNTYLEIVRHYVKLRGIDLDDGVVEREALMWARERGSFSGRVAHQFVKDLEGRYRLGLVNL